jgi:uncharacterized protein (TIGR00255 family)
MTGYGAGEARSGPVVVKVELRSVNHRFFDAAIRISREHAGLEGRVKELLAERVSRGRVTATVDVTVESADGGIVVDEALAAAYRKVLDGLVERHRLSGSTDAIAFAQLPDLIRRVPPEVPAEQVEEALLAAMRSSLEELSAMRAREGQALAAELGSRLDRLGQVVEGVEQASGGSVQRVKDRLRERIAQLVPEGLAPDAERLALEVAILSDKADVTEEVARFRAHLAAFREFLGRDEAVGKRLDFLLQELNREANTIGSKSVSAEVTHLVVEAKEEIERLREQVQNVE